MEEIKTELQTKDSSQTESTEQMVPFAEAMRYRQKAQEAEQRVDELTRQLEDMKSPRNQTTDGEEPNVAARTSGAKDPRSRGSACSQAARRALKSGRRADVHEYMRTRRNYPRTTLL